jgi:hypothetical protein
MFKDLWRKFQLRVHPDLFTAYPELQAANSASLQKLQGILNDARTKERTTDDASVKPRTESLQFFLRAQGSGGGGGGGGAGGEAPPTFLRVPLTIRVPGTHCKNVLGDSMVELFKHAGLPSTFHWGPEYWGSTCVWGWRAATALHQIAARFTGSREHPATHPLPRSRSYTLSKKAKDTDDDE